MRLTVVTFYTPQLEAARDALERALSPHVDAFDAYTLERLDAESEWWRCHYRDHSHDPAMRLPSNPGADRIGYWKYKPLLLQLALERGAQRWPGEEHVALYLDVNCFKYPLLAGAPGALRDACARALLLAGADIWIGVEGLGLRVKHHCKAHTVRAVMKGLGGAAADACLEGNLLNCSRIVVRRSSASAAWLAEVLGLMEDDDLLAPIPDAPPHPDLRWHTGDQAVWAAWSALKVHAGALPKHWPGSMYDGPDRAFEASRLVPLD